eukprot:6478281-Amphidinium_carterae.1
MSVVGAFSAAELSKVAQITCIADLASWAQLPPRDVASLLGLREDELPTAPVSLLAVFNDEEFAGLVRARLLRTAAVAVGTLAQQAAASFGQVGPANGGAGVGGVVAATVRKLKMSSVIDVQDDGD